jgi:DNA-binding winged helix-turn-helix (wHTH) protein/TolB-like protein
MAYAFGPFRYDAEQKLLFRGSEVVPLVPKVVETLQALLERRGRIVEKNELIRLVWPDTVVEDGGLARNISLLRKALDDGGGEAAYIETVPRRGYRFRAEAAEVPVATPAARRRKPILAAALGMFLLAAFVYWQFYHPSRYLPAGASRASIAVVPFDCLAPCPADGAVSREFQEVLTAELAQYSDVQVISPSTVRRYQKVGVSMVWMARLLNLDVILEGAIQPLADRTRVTARLADVHSGKLIWAENLDTQAGEFRITQKEVAQAIARQVSAQLRR